MNEHVHTEEDKQMKVEVDLVIGDTAEVFAKQLGILMNGKDAMTITISARMTEESEERIDVEIQVAAHNMGPEREGLAGLLHMVADSVANGEVAHEEILEKSGS